MLQGRRSHSNFGFSVQLVVLESNTSATELEDEDDLSSPPSSWMLVIGSPATTRTNALPGQVDTFQLA